MGHGAAIEKRRDGFSTTEMQHVLLVDVEGMRSAVYWAAWCIGAGHADASVAASTA